MENSPGARVKAEMIPGRLYEVVDRADLAEEAILWAGPQPGTDEEMVDVLVEGEIVRCEQTGGAQFPGRYQVTDVTEGAHSGEVGWVNFLTETRLCWCCRRGGSRSI